jgi:ribonuclease H2 subunit C
MDQFPPQSDTGILSRHLVTSFLLLLKPKLTISPDGKTISYFRGRKLHGKALKLPAGYKGMVVSSTERVLPKASASSQQGDEEDAEEAPEVKAMEEQADFDEIMVWGHEALPDETMDPYVRGVDEWIAFAEQVVFRLLLEKTLTD